MYPKPPLLTDLANEKAKKIEKARTTTSQKEMLSVYSTVKQSIFGHPLGDDGVMAESDNHCCRWWP